LDHRVVIQMPRSCVMFSMELAAHLEWPNADLFVAVFARAPEHSGCVREAFPEMSADQELAREREDWAALIGAIAEQQNRAAFAQLFEYFAPRIKTYMRRSGSTESSAEELAQETLLAVWRKAHLFNPSSAGAAAWIFAIARNQRIDAARRANRGGAVETSDVEAEFVIDDSPLPDARLATAQSEDQVRAALAHLSSDQLRVVELSFFEEKAHGEIAQILDIPLGTVKSRLRLAMGRLRNLLGETP
jgi:RNA polymerase sigma-70 factor, ECF subfamily